MERLIDHISNLIKDRIERKSFLGALAVVLALLSCIVRFLPVAAQRRRISDGRVYIECLRQNHARAADILIDFAGRESLGADTIRLFLYEIIANVGPGAIRRLMDARYVDPELLPLLEAARLRAVGSLDLVLEKLNYTPKGFSAGVHVAEFTRTMLLEERRHEQFAEYGSSYLSRNSDQILFQYAASVAAAADSAGRDDILGMAVRRIFDDRETVLREPQLLSRFAEQAANASMWLLDLDGVKRIIQALDAARMKQAAGRLRANFKIDDMEAVSDLAAEAHRDILERAGLEQQNHRQCDADAIIVFPSAALRFNKIDYPAFRNDIRFVLRTVADSLTSMNLRYRVKGQIKLHGNEDLKVPFFSYHTVSEGRKGLHFKETDRPSHFSFDRGGYSGWSEFSEKTISELQLNDVDMTTAADFFQEDKQRIIGGNLSKYQQMSFGNQEKLPERFVFVALQMAGDSVQDLAYFSATAMLEEVMAACEALGYRVVVKRHPLCGSIALGNFVLENVKAGRIIAVKGSIHSIITKAVAVCVVNSGVGAEALLHEKPVYVFGRSEYMAACFVCAGPGDFARQFPAQAMAVLPEDLFRFWYVLRKRYAIDLRDRDKAREAICARVGEHMKRSVGSGGHTGTLEARL